MGRRFFLFLLFTTYLFIFPFGHIIAQDSAESDSLKKLGLQLYAEGDFDAAEEAFSAILLIDSNSINARNNLGVLNKTLGRYNDALTFYFEGERILRRDSGTTCRSLGNIYNNIGIVYNQKQDYELALQYLNFAEKIYKTNGMRNHPANTVYSNIGNSYFGMNNFRKALQSYQDGIEMKNSTDKKGLDKAYANCASTYEYLDELDSASMYYKYSIQAKIDRTGVENYELIPTYNSYAALLQKMGDFKEAFHLLSRALELAEERYSDKHPDVAETHRHLANWYLETGEFNLALDHFQKGIDAAVFDFNSTNFYDNPELDNEIISEPELLEILMGKSKALYSLYKQSGNTETLLASLKTQELANMLAEKMRSSYLGELSKLLITGYARAGFDRYVHTAYELYTLSGDVSYANKAFMSAEKSKSSVLMASLQEVERKKNLGIPAEIQSLEEELKQEKDIYKKKLYEESQFPIPDQQKLAVYQEKIFYLSQQLDSLDNHIRERFPAYAAKYDNIVIDITGVMEKLDDDRVLMEYSISDTCLFIFVISKEQFNIHKLRVDSTFHANLSVLGQFLRNNAFANNSISEFRAYLDAAYSLYKMFILPAEEQIAGKKLLIIPDGGLGYIPFEALLTELPSGEVMDYRNLPYLLYKYRTNYSYSATLYFGENNKHASTQKKLIAFAPTYENVGEINSDKFPANREFSTYLVPLRFISKEIQSISAILDCETYEGYAATERVFKDEAPEYDILHLAMHTLINDENPMYSKLVFTLNNDTVEDNDGLLNAYEIFNMKLNARMAVLSACNTGYGKMQKGEGVMSMARGFIYAGVPSIIMTLWAVEDQSGSILMSKFYQNLVDGMDIDEAMQEAKLQYLGEANQLSAHPYLWSGYVSFGSTDALITSPALGKYYLYIIAALGLVVIIFLVIWFRRRRKRA